VCGQYAADGYFALAPDLFWRTQPRIELAYDGAGVAKGMELALKTDIDLFVADIAATAGLPRTRPDVAGKLAAIGYCFGGRLTYLAAATGKIDVAVAYYGGSYTRKLVTA
jgi:carboxymethylenebutenolidase